MLTKKLVIILLAVVVVIIALGIWAGLYFFGGSQAANPAAPSDYAAVYLATGDIYFGKISWLPWPRLKDVWFLQRVAGPDGQPQLSINRFTNSFWGPTDTLYLNPKQIIFWTRLRNDSQVLKAFINPSAVLGSGNLPPARQPASTSTFRGPSSPPPSAR